MMCCTLFREICRNCRSDQITVWTLSWDINKKKFSKNENVPWKKITVSGATPYMRSSGQPTCLELRRYQFKVFCNESKRGWGGIIHARIRWFKVSWLHRTPTRWFGLKWSPPWFRDTVLLGSVLAPVCQTPMSSLLFMLSSVSPTSCRFTIFNSTDFFEPSGLNSETFECGLNVVKF